MIDTIPPKKTLSKIQFINGTTIQGYILDANDSSITVVRKENWKRFDYDQTESYKAEQISRVTKNFKNGLTAGEGMLIGAGTGIILGFSLGLSQDCDDPNGECDFFDKLLSTRSFTASFILGGTLGLAGMLIGLFSKKKDRVLFNINGNRNNIRNNRNGLIY